MRVYPVVSNVINVELKDGSMFSLYEGVEGLDIKSLNGKLVLRELNVKTLGLDEVWKGSTINLTEEREHPK